MSAWEKKPAIEGGSHPCLCCGVIAPTFGTESIIAVGFGGAYLMKGLECVYDEQDVGHSREDYMTGAEAEALAAADPDHDWQIVLYGPLSERTYRRHSEGHWVLIHKGQGFA